MQSPNSAQMPFFVGSDINYIAWQYVSGMTCKVPKQVSVYLSPKCARHRKKNELFVSAPIESLFASQLSVKENQA